MDGFRAFCPHCQKLVSASVTIESVDNLLSGQGDVELGHPADDPSVRDHMWILTDSVARTRLRKLWVSKGVLMARRSASTKS